MIQTFTIPDRLPGINEYTASQRSNKYSGALMKKYAQKQVEVFIRAAKLPRMRTPIRIVYTFFEPNRRRDKDNISGFAHKVIQDALVGCGIIEDDGWEQIAGWTDSFALDKDRPRIEVTLIEVKGCETDLYFTDHFMKRFLSWMTLTGSPRST